MHAGDFYQNCTMGASAACGPREPWQDIHALVVGPTAVDIHDNFVDRWCQQNPDMRSCLFNLSDMDFNLDAPADVPDEQGGPWHAQLLRSITLDSALMSQERLEFLNRKYGCPVEDSIQRQYVNLIRQTTLY